MDLENLLCSRDGFGLESATFLQRFKARAIDGADTSDLLARATDFERRCAEIAIGCDPSKLHVGLPPVEVGDFGPVRTAKSLSFAALATARARTVDVSMIKAGEEGPRISILATQVDQAHAIRGHLNMLRERKKLSKYVIGDDDDSVTIRHPSGLAIQIRVIAASRGGYSLASRWSATVIFDEAPGWHSTDKIVSLEDSADQAIGRLLPGAQVIYGGSVWQPSGKCFVLDRDHYGKPSADLLVLRPRTVDEITPAEQLNPVYWTPQRVARVRKTRSFKMHVLNEFGGASSVFDYDAAQRAFSPFPKAYQVGRPVGIVDPSSGKKDTWSFCVVQWIEPAVKDEDWLREPAPGVPDGVLMLDEYDRPIPRAGKGTSFLAVWRIGGFEGNFWDQLKNDELVAHVAEQFHTAGVTTVIGDNRESYSLEAEFRRNGLRYIERPYTAESKPRAVERVRRWLKDSAVIIEPHDRMRGELVNFVEKPTPGGGFTFGARGNGHDDYVCLLLTAALADMAGDIPRSPIRKSSERVAMPDAFLGIAGDPELRGY